MSDLGNVLLQRILDHFFQISHESIIEYQSSPQHEEFGKLPEELLQSIKSLVVLSANFQIPIIRALISWKSKAIRHYTKKKNKVNKSTTLQPEKREKNFQLPIEISEFTPQKYFEQIVKPSLNYNELTEYYIEYLFIRSVELLVESFDDPSVVLIKLILRLCSKQLPHLHRKGLFENKSTIFVRNVLTIRNLYGKMISNLSKKKPAFFATKLIHNMNRSNVEKKIYPLEYINLQISSGSSVNESLSLLEKLYDLYDNSAIASSRSLLWPLSSILQRISENKPQILEGTAWRSLVKKLSIQAKSLIANRKKDRQIALLLFVASVNCDAETSLNRKEKQIDKLVKIISRSLKWTGSNNDHLELPYAAVLNFFKVYLRNKNNDFKPCKQLSKLIFPINRGNEKILSPIIIYYLEEISIILSKVQPYFFINNILAKLLIVSDKEEEKENEKENENENENKNGNENDKGHDNYSEEKEKAKKNENKRKKKTKMNMKMKFKMKIHKKKKEKEKKKEKKENKETKKIKIHQIKKIEREGKELTEKLEKEIIERIKNGLPLGLGFRLENKNEKEKKIGNEKEKNEKKKEKEKERERERENKDLKKDETKKYVQIIKKKMKSNTQVYLLSFKCLLSTFSLKKTNYFGLENYLNNNTDFNEKIYQREILNIIPLLSKILIKYSPVVLKSQCWKALSYENFYELNSESINCKEIIRTSILFLPKIILSPIDLLKLLCSLSTHFDYSLSKLAIDSLTQFYKSYPDLRSIISLLFMNEIAKIPMNYTNLIYDSLNQFYKFLDLWVTLTQNDQNYLNTPTLRNENMNQNNINNLNNNHHETIYPKKVKKEDFKFIIEDLDIDNNLINIEIEIFLFLKNFQPKIKKLTWDLLKLCKKLRILLNINYFDNSFYNNDTMKKNYGGYFTNFIQDDMDENNFFTNSEINNNNNNNNNNHILYINDRDDHKETENDNLKKDFYLIDLLKEKSYLLLNDTLFLDHFKCFYINKLSKLYQSRINKNNDYKENHLSNSKKNESINVLKYLINSNFLKDQKIISNYLSYIITEISNKKPNLLKYIFNREYEHFIQLYEDYENNFEQNVIEKKNNNNKNKQEELINGNRSKEKEGLILKKEIETEQQEQVPRQGQEQQQQQKQQRGRKQEQEEQEEQEQEIKMDGKLIYQLGYSTIIICSASNYKYINNRQIINFTKILIKSLAIQKNQHFQTLIITSLSYFNLSSFEILFDLLIKYFEKILKKRRLKNSNKIKLDHIIANLLIVFRLFLRNINPNKFSTINNLSNKIYELLRKFQDFISNDFSKFEENVNRKKNPLINLIRIRYNFSLSFYYFLWLLNENHKPYKIEYRKDLFNLLTKFCNININRYKYDDNSNVGNKNNNDKNKPQGNKNDKDNGKDKSNQNGFFYQLDNWITEKQFKSLNLKENQLLVFKKQFNSVEFVTMQTISLLLYGVVFDEELLNLNGEIFKWIFNTLIYEKNKKYIAYEALKNLIFHNSKKLLPIYLNYSISIEKDIKYAFVKALIDLMSKKIIKIEQPVLINWIIFHLGSINQNIRSSVLELIEDYSTDIFGELEEIPIIETHLTQISDKIIKFQIHISKFIAEKVNLEITYKVIKEIEKHFWKLSKIDNTNKNKDNTNKNKHNTNKNKHNTDTNKHNTDTNKHDTNTNTNNKNTNTNNKKEDDVGEEILEHYENEINNKNDLQKITKKNTNLNKIIEIQEQIIKYLIPWLNKIKPNDQNVDHNKYDFYNVIKFIIKISQLKHLRQELIKKLWISLIQNKNKKIIEIIIEILIYKGIGDLDLNYIKNTKEIIYYLIKSNLKINIKNIILNYFLKVKNLKNYSIFKLYSFLFKNNNKKKK
ncbi:protein furry [Anaeramoeba flamelloides]|uniref:Protein furry n=1 Tax=Anaeramoeba flamelloides TaxID=1746091 RepID=A0ABQ8YN76_9EUKA|nr:protein furry [Anaeramoeba flamelloides]